MNDFIKIGDYVNVIFSENFILYDVRFMDRCEGIYVFRSKKNVVYEVKNFLYLERRAAREDLKRDYR